MSSLLWPRFARQFCSGQAISPNTVLYISMRNASPLNLGNYLQAAALSALCSASDRVEFERMLETGSAYDFHRVSRWIQQANLPLRAKRDSAKPPLELVVANVQTDVPALMSEIIGQQRRPAGIILSGSGSFVTETFHDTNMQQLKTVLEQVQAAVPVLGICFGFQFLCAMRYGIEAVQWFRTPPGASAEIRWDAVLEEMVPVDVWPNARRLSTGVIPVHFKQHRHGLVDGYRTLPALALHSQYVDAASVPDDHILAYTDRKFLVGGGSHTTRVVQAAYFGDGQHGVQFHPELHPYAVLAVSQDADYTRLMYDQMIPHGSVQNELRAFDRYASTAEIVGAAFVRQVAQRYSPAAK